ncbi:hypothetical protein DWB61_13115 [Ancylomarina euxinus]|uniref:Uncharacterized protein n=1 Tax=Ancylomarina euxinus TaxID=2283627 RepID=A0A425XZ24_9BACT|nr:hypothetical protein [Ancylomarina euxinus]MCZ4695657.1 hypothetical protein [Ancylomarina euxinus]MUP16039.1 hypothetical protein [Ancylomarina euxinus]RRG20283.1 hypothetical protein DWB61_13115 [Ancylomarina euxinus]
MLKFSIRLSYFLILLGFSFVSVACQNKTKPDSSNIKDELVANHQSLKKVKNIFYNVPSPVEVTNIIQRMNLPYHPDLLNPSTNSDNYLTQADKALNMGVYGADLSYIRIYEQYQDAAKFLVVVKKFTRELGIPEEGERVIAKRLEENIQNQDSLLRIITETFTDSDSYLKENQRGSTAALIIFGGWIETLYLATNILDNSSPQNDMVKLIVEQRYSVKNLLALMEQFSNEKRVQDFLPDLKELNIKFQEIGQEKSGQAKLISKKGKTVIGNKVTLNIPHNILNDVKTINDRIRTRITEM